MSTTCTLETHSVLSNSCSKPSVNIYLSKYKSYIPIILRENQHITNQQILIYTCPFILSNGISPHTPRYTPFLHFAKFSEVATVCFHMASNTHKIHHKADKCDHYRANFTGLCLQIFLVQWICLHFHHCCFILQTL